MKIATFSYRDFEQTRHGWCRGGTRISYRQSGINREGTLMNYYTLHFEYTPTHDHDVVLFSHCFPYTYNDLDQFLQKKMLKKKELRLAKIQIGKSISGLPLYVLKFGDNSKISDNPNTVRNHMKRKSLVFMARQHSG
jgi:hypothetical protein